MNLYICPRYVHRHAKGSGHKLAKKYGGPYVREANQNLVLLHKICHKQITNSKSLKELLGLCNASTGLIKLPNTMHFPSRVVGAA